MSRSMVILLMVCVTAVLHVAIRQAQGRASVAGQAPASIEIPSLILEFRQAGPDIPVDESVRNSLETNAILMRTYVSPRGVPVALTTVYAGVTRRSLHFPEVCLTGQGWDVSEQTSVQVGMMFTGKRLILAKGKAREAVLYWFKTGQNFTGNYFLNSLYWARDTLLLRSPSTMMIRLGTPIGAQGEAAAFRILEDFAVALAPTLIETVH